MSLMDFVEIAAIPFGLLMTFTASIVGVALATNKNRVATIKAIQSRDFGFSRFSGAAELWSLYFQYFFGERIFAKRQLVTIPIYTLTVSAIFFLIWIADLYIFRNPWHSFAARLPLTFKLSVQCFYHEGIFAALLIDTITIQLTKIAIRIGRNKGYFSIRFWFSFLMVFIFAYFIFSLAIFYFRVEDMVLLYLDQAPNDPIPVMPYAPFDSFQSSLSLFYPQTLIHMTSQGMFTTYFMPEPLIFYCAIMGTLSLLSITICFQIAWMLERLKRICIGFVTYAGKPEAHATSILMLVLGILFLLVISVICIIVIA